MHFCSSFHSNFRQGKTSVRSSWIWVEYKLNTSWILVEYELNTSWIWVEYELKMSWMQVKYWRMYFDTLLNTRKNSLFFGNGPNAASNGFGRPRLGWLHGIYSLIALYTWHLANNFIQLFYHRVVQRQSLAFLFFGYLRVYLLKCLLCSVPELHSASIVNWKRYCHANFSLPLV